MKTQVRMSLTELYALPVSVDIVTGGRAFGLGRSTAYELVRRGEFPVPVLQLGSRYRVNRADIFRALGVAEQDTKARPA